MGDVKRFFGNKLSIEEAFHTISKTSVQTFFENVQRNPIGYGFPEKWDHAKTENFKDFLNVIKKSASISSAKLSRPLTLPFAKSTDPDPAAALLPMNTIFDFMGWVFSAANPAPDDASEDNFYLPLAAIYAKFCRVLAAAYDKDYQTQPHIITLGHYKLHDQGHVILGATIGHASIDKYGIQKSRKEQLIAHGVIGAGDKKIANWDYGYCAESMFFTYVHGRKGEVKDTYGLALNLNTYEEKHGKLSGRTVYDGEEFKPCRVAPCANCQHIIGKLGLTLDHFKPH